MFLRNTWQPGSLMWEDLKTWVSLQKVGLSESSTSLVFSRGLLNNWCSGLQSYWVSMRIWLVHVLSFKARAVLWATKLIDALGSKTHALSLWKPRVVMLRLQTNWFSARQLNFSMIWVSNTHLTFWRSLSQKREYSQCTLNMLTLWVSRSSQLGWCSGLTKQQRSSL